MAPASSRWMLIMNPAESPPLACWKAPEILDSTPKHSKRSGNGASNLEQLGTSGHLLHSLTGGSDLEMDGERCFQLMDTDSPELFGRWVASWSDLVSFEVIALEKPSL